MKTLVIRTLLAAAFALSASASALAHPCPALGPASGNEVIQEFAPGGPGGAYRPAWRVQYGFAVKRGLYITGAFYRMRPADPWMRVLWDARLSDIFVPYHSGSPRYYDLSAFSFDLVPATAADAGPCGRILGGKVVNQVSDAELAWKNNQEVRYRQAMVLWATLGAANYNYVIRYEFRDDGTIALRLGATAENLPTVPWEAHMHDGLWRVDIDLKGASYDTAYLMRHVEPSGGAGAASDVMSVFNNGVEGAAEWKAEEFTHLLVRDEPPIKGISRFPLRRIGYEFMPVRMGSARHAEGFSKNDFWVTAYNGAEMSLPNIAAYQNGQSVVKSDVVVWHLSPAHHLPRGEDGFVDNGSWNGVALIMWSGVDIRPRNLWSRTPLYPNQ